MFYKCQEIDEKSQREGNCRTTLFFHTDKISKQFLFDKGQRSDKLTQVLREPIVKKELNHGRNENRL